MVCASSLAASVPSAGKMAFMDWRGLDDLSEKGCLPTGDAGRTALAAQVVPEPPAAAAPAGVITPTPAMKDVLRLRKKLREIAKIEEQLAAGMRIDPLQQSKVGKKEEVLAQLQQAERAAIGEEEGGGAEQPEESDRQGPARRAEERQQQQQQQQRPASHQPPQVGVQVLPVAPCQIAAVSIFQVPVMVCAIIGQPPLGQQPQQQQPQQPQQPQQLQLQLQPQPQQPQRPQQPQQLQLQLQPQPQQPQRPQQLQQLQQPQQAFTWQAYAAVSAQEPRFAPMGQQAAAQAQAWDDESAYQDGQPTKTALSTSARRRLRRQRAALRSPGAMEVPAEADAPQSDLSSPCSTASSGKSDGPSGCQELTSALEGSDEARNAALAKLRGSVADLAFERQGCRLVQDAIEVADHATAAELVSELHGRVRDALASPHGNYVIQTVVTALPSGLSGFVVKELRGVGAAVARHRFGCRVLCRLIEHSGANGELSALVGEVLAEAEELVRHPFAHHVVECALEHMPERRPRIAEALAADPAANACHRCASHVVEAALLHCAEKDRQLLAEGLLGRVGVAALAHHQFGCFVLKALLRAPGRASQEARGQLQREAPSLSTSRPGQRLLRDLGFTSAPAA